MYILYIYKLCVGDFYKCKMKKAVCFYKTIFSLKEYCPSFVLNLEIANFHCFPYIPVKHIYQYIYLSKKSTLSKVSAKMYLILLLLDTLNHGPSIIVNHTLVAKSGHVLHDFMYPVNDKNETHFGRYLP